MQAAKRLWIYAGLAVPEGVALVRRGRPRPAALRPRLVLLVGDETARRLAAPLDDLAAGSATHIVVCARDGSSATEWAADGSFAAQLERIMPGAVLYALDGTDVRAVAALMARPRRLGAEGWWLPPPGRTVIGVRSVPPPLWALRAGRAASVGTYAAWAGSIWRALE